MNAIKRVFYKGKPYEYQASEEKGNKYFSLYKRGILVHFVGEQELDKRWPLTIMLANALKGPQPA